MGWQIIFSIQETSETRAFASSLAISRNQITILAAVQKFVFFYHFYCLLLFKTSFFDATYTSFATYGFKESTAISL